MSSTCREKSPTNVLRIFWVLHKKLTTLSVFKFAQYYFSRGLKFAHFEFAHPKQTYSRGLEFAHLSWIDTTKNDKNRWIEAIFPKE